MNKIFSTRLQGCVTRHEEKKEEKEEREKEKEDRNETNTIRLFVSSDNEVDFHVVDC